MFRRIPGQLVRRGGASHHQHCPKDFMLHASANKGLTATSALITSLRFVSNSNTGSDDHNPTSDGSDTSATGPSSVVKPSFDRFGGEASFTPPAAGEEIDLTANVGSRVPWPEVQRQLQLFVSNSVTDPKSGTKGRTFLRDFDVLSNITSISDGLELLYYMQRLSYPPNSKLEVSLVSWLIDNVPLISSRHLLDVCRYALEQKSFEFWKRCLLLTDAFIPHFIDLLHQPELSLEDYVLIARVLQHSREEYESAQKKSMLPGVEYAKKRPILRVLVQRVAEMIREEGKSGAAVSKSDAEAVVASGRKKKASAVAPKPPAPAEAISPEIVGNVIKHVANLDPSCPAQRDLIESIEEIFRASTAVDAMRYLTAMSESGAFYTSLLEALVERIDQHARKALAPPTTKRGQRKVTKRANIRAIRDDPDEHEESEAIVDVTFITRAFMLVSKISRESDPSIGEKLLNTLRPAVEAIVKLLEQRQRLLEEPTRLVRLLSDLTEVSDIVNVNTVRNNDPMLETLRHFVRSYARSIDLAVQQGEQVDNITLEECGFCLKISSRLLDNDLTAEIGAKIEELCTIAITAANGNNGINLSLEGSLRILEGLAAVGSFPPRIIEACVRVAMENRSNLSSKDVSVVIFVAGLCKGAKFDSEIFHQLTGRLLNTAKFRRNDVLGPNAVAQLLRGLAAAGIKPDERLQAFLSEQALKYTSDFSVRDSTSLLIVVHQLKLDQSTVGQRLGLEVAASIPYMNADDLVRLASVLAELNLRDVSMLDSIGFRLRDCFGELKARHLTQYAMSLRELNFMTMFSKCGLADIVPAIDDLSPNDATFLMAFCSPATQEVIIGKFIKDVNSLKYLNPASLITIYGAAPDHLEHIRTHALKLLEGKECPLTVSADVGCLALCRAIGTKGPGGMRQTQASIAAIAVFLAPVAHKFTSTQLEVIIEHLRRVIVDSVPVETRLQNEEREMMMEKEDKIAAFTKEAVIKDPKSQVKNEPERMMTESKFTISLRGSTFDVPAALYRFLGRRICANIDFLSAESCISVLEIYMHGRVRDDKVVKTLFKRLGKASRPIVNSPRLTRIAIALVDYFSPAWAPNLSSVLKAKTTVRTREIVRSALEE